MKFGLGAYGTGAGRSGGHAVFWDRKLSGFGIRVYASGRKVYVVQVRGPGGSRRVTLGRHEDLGVEKARKQAAPAIDRIKRGEEPQPAEPVPPAEPTVADLVERYFRVHVASHCSAKTAEGYRYVVGKHILPALGTMLVRDVAGADVAALRLLMLTGCRRQEIVTLRWDGVDRTARDLRLRHAKTGPRTVALTPPVERVLDGIPRVEGSPWVIPGRKPDTHLADLHDHWERIRDRAGLEDMRIHDIRHSYATAALEAGESLTMIGRLLGHSRVTTTARYAHLRRDSEKAAAVPVDGNIGAHIGREVVRPAPALDSG